MNKNLLKSYMAKAGDTQADLAEAIGMSLSRLNAKINETAGAEFTQSEISFISKRYRLSGREIIACFFNQKVS